MTNRDIERLKAPKAGKIKKQIKNELYLIVSCNGSKSFYMRYRDEKHDTMRKLGDFAPNFGIKEACRELKVQQKTIQLSVTKCKTLKEAFKEFLKFKSASLSDKSIQRYESVFKHFSKLQDYEMNKIKSTQFIDAINQIGHLKEMPKRMLSLINELYAFMSIREDNIFNPLFKVKPSLIIEQQHKSTPFKTLTKPNELKELFKTIINSDMKELYKLAFALQALTTLRTDNIRSLRWDYISDDDMLCIPAAAMKMQRAFYLPLNTQAQLAIIKISELIGKNSTYLFQAKTTTTRSEFISENTLRQALRRAGIDKDTFTPHGFRSMFSTIANEHNQASEIIELCLAHTASGIRGIYDRSHRIEAKRELMQWWGDYLEPYLADLLI